MNEFFEACFTFPTVLATLLLFLCCVYWILIVIGAFDLDVFEFDLDLDGDADVLSTGFVALKFLNIGNVPLMLWMSIFALGWWTLSMLDLWPESPDSVGTVLPAVYEMVGNIGLSLLLTKLVTQPLRGRFDPVEPNRAEDLIGRECVITTFETTADYGQARLETESSPLMLHVRALDGVVRKNETAKIVDFDTERNIYYVTPVKGETEP